MKNNTSIIDRSNDGNLSPDAMGEYDALNGVSWWEGYQYWVGEKLAEYLSAWESAREGERWATG